MGWLDSWFSWGPLNSPKNQALSSTHEAFSLPTTSPGMQAHPDAFNPEMFGSESTSNQYTYPPQSASSYTFTPTLQVAYCRFSLSTDLPSSRNESRQRQASLLPLHNSPRNSLSPPHNYPPLAQTWNRLRTWLGREYPELGDTLNYGILPEDLAQIEMQFGFELPAVVRESYLVVDGQEAESSAGCPEGLFFGLTLLPLDDVLEEWRFWREVDQDPSTGANSNLRELMQSLPPGWIRKEYSQQGWIPLIADRGGNYIGIDLNPGAEGATGQVIVFGRDFDTKVVLWNGDGAAGWAKWLASFVEELEGGEGYEIGQNGDQSEGSEDGVGYESYFHDGTGRGQGDAGGDSGSGGGLRFTGEYRGWSPLEAWADRSVRKWYQAGAIPDLSAVEQPDTNKV
jgi:cell wall assembly regulator SMI1